MIKENDTVYEVIKKYPELKEVLIKINPKFAQLNNPILFNTVAKVTTFKKVAKIGKIYINELLLELNEAIGERENFLQYVKQTAFRKKDEFLGKQDKKEDTLPPNWMPTNEENWQIFDVRNDEVDPFLKIKEFSENIKSGEGFILIQKFEPIPLITYLTRNNFLAYTREINENEYKIYFLKNK